MGWTAMTPTWVRTLSWTGSISYGMPSPQQCPLEVGRCPWRLHFLRCSIPPSASLPRGTCQKPDSYTVGILHRDSLEHRGCGAVADRDSDTLSVSRGKTLPAVLRSLQPRACC